MRYYSFYDRYGIQVLAEGILLIPSVQCIFFSSENKNLNGLVNLCSLPFM